MNNTNNEFGIRIIVPEIPFQDRICYYNLSFTKIKTKIETPKNEKNNKNRSPKIKFKN